MQTFNGSLQPHKGSSERGLRGRDRQPERRRFNPTKVRLKGSAVEDGEAAIEGFNPTKVRLKAKTATSDRRAVSSFNPTKVRLKAV